MDNSVDPTLESMVYSYLKDKCSQLISCTEKFGELIGSASQVKPNLDLECYVNAGRRQAIETHTTDKKRKARDLSEADNNKRIKLTISKKTKKKSQINSKKCDSSGSSSSFQNDSSHSYLTNNKTLTNILSPISEIQIKPNRSESKQSSSGDVTITQLVNNYSDDSSEEEIPKSFSPITDKNSTDEELPSISKLFQSDYISIKHDKETETSDANKKHTKRRVKHSDKKQKDLRKPEMKKKSL